MVRLIHLLLAAAGVSASGAQHLHPVSRHLSVPAHHHGLPPHRGRRRVHYIHLPVLSHIRVHGPAIDYVGLFLLAGVTGLGVNGFGEATLIAAAVYVANHHVAIAPVVLIAAAGAYVGGIAAFVIGRHGARRVLTAPGPIAAFRRRTLAHSEEVFLHYDALAILVTPSWAAGIHGVRWVRFLLINVASALLWAAALGLGAYYLGPRITTEFSDEIGWIVGGVAGVLVLCFVLRRALRSPSRQSGPG